MNSPKSKRHELTGDQSLQDLMLDFHLPLQKVILLLGGPATFAIFMYWHWVNPCWQSSLLVGGDLLMITVWGFGFRLAKKGNIGASVFCFSLAAALQGVAVAFLLDGYELSALWAIFAGMMYAGLFDRRPLYVCLGLAIFTPPAVELIKWLNLYPMVKVPSNYLLFPTIGMSALVGGFILFFLVRSQGLNGRMFQSLADANTGQEHIIATVQKILPDIGQALEKIETISATVSYQAHQLATATSQITVTMNGVNEKAIETTNTARSTNSVSESTYEISRRNFDQFREVEVGFEKRTKSISSAAEEVTQLASQLERIEEILAVNRQIGEQITLLAVNATIEADEAGSFGTVFGDVAREFKGMIQDTEENLGQTRTLLQGIRDQARESASALVEGAHKLSHYFEELQATGLGVEENLHRFRSTAEQLAEIDEAALRQQQSVQEISLAMAEIDRATVELSRSAAILERNVARIAGSGKQLGDIIQLKS